MEEVIPGTICCLLCRGLVIFKNGDKSRFKAHLNNEHGAFFDIDYLLASSLMDTDQKAQVANTVKVNETETSQREPDTSEEASNQEPTNESSQFVCGSCSTHFTAKTSYIQHITKGCKKDALKSGYSCNSCDKSYSSKGNLNVHVVKHHAQETVKQENVDPMETQEAAPFQSYYQQEEDRSQMNFSSSDASYGEGFVASNAVGQDSMQSSRDEEISSVKTSFEEETNVSGVHDQTANDELDKELKKNLPCGVCNKMFGSSKHLAKHVIKKHNGQEEGGHALSKPQKEFVCMYQPCTKSFSSKQTLWMHERKAHDRPLMKKGRRSKKDALNQSSSLDNSSLTESYQQDSQPNTEYPEVSSVFNDPGAVVNSFQNIGGAEPNTTLEELETVAVSPVEIHLAVPPAENQLSSFLTDTNLDFDNFPIPEEDNMSQCDSQTDGMVNLNDFDDKNDEHYDQSSNSNPKPSVDVTKSKYFIKNPNVFANARGKSVKLFDEEAKDLPEGWKMRSIEVKSKTGSGMSTIKHYLTPDTKVLKTGLSVIEYLRLEGSISTDKILEISRKLNVSEKKLRNLYMTD